MKLFKRLFAPFAALLAVAAPTAARAPQQAKPALWEVSDADTKVYLFGTIHLLPQNYRWRTPTFDQAVAGSQQLVVETIVDENNPHQMMAAMTSLAFSPDLPPIIERVPAAKRPALQAAIRKSGMTEPMFDKMETWAAAFMLLGNQFRAMGLKTGEGVEQNLRSSFSSQGKKVGELESNREQLAFFDILPEEAQRMLLEGAIDETQDMTKEFDQMLSSWARGDVQGIAKSFNDTLAVSPDLREILLRRRNENWSRWVRQRMAAPGSVMVAVGAGHLAGSDSLVDMLRRGGYKVRRLQ